MNKGNQQVTFVTTSQYTMYFALYVTSYLHTYERSVFNVMPFISKLCVSKVFRLALNNLANEVISVNVHTFYQWLAMIKHTILAGNMSVKIPMSVRLQI